MKADNILVELEENTINIGNVIVGIYDGSLVKTGKYQALIGLDLLDEGGVQNEYIRSVET